MTLRVLTSLLASAAATLLAAASPSATTPPGARLLHWVSAKVVVTVDGTSTLHDWTVKGDQASGTMQIPVATAGRTLAPSPGLVQATLVIPVKSLRGEADGLNSRMYAALEADKHPLILFTLDHVTLAPGPSSATWLIAGKLELDGTTRAIEIPAKVVLNDDGSLDVDASAPISMKDYHIKPPTFMLGALRAGDEVKTRVNWHLVAAKDN